MSQRALLLAARDAIQQALNVGREVCSVQFDGQPEPAAGELFLAVWPGEWSAQSGDADLDETHGINVTITRRLGYSPQDRFGPEVLVLAEQGLLATAEQVRVALHMDYERVLSRANTLIGSQANGFVEPLQFRGPMGRPEPKQADWFSACADEGCEHVPLGLALTLTFGGARRVQTIPSMT